MHDTAVKVGDRFGRMVVIQRLENKIYANGGTSRRWLCRCACGKDTEVFQQALTRGRTKSCGCYNAELAAERSTKHGMFGAKIYGVWGGMVKRCTNRDSKDYKNYGSRGIAVCEEWRDFENFYRDMGDVPFDGAEIDRIDSDGNYSKDNCRWITRQQNTWNRGKQRARATSSKYVGVAWEKDSRRWVASIRVNGKTKKIGRFIVEEDAALAYDNIAIVVRGEYAVTNFPRSSTYA
jgi:hypothetical protein